MRRSTYVVAAFAFCVVSGFAAAQSASRSTAPAPTARDFQRASSRRTPTDLDRRVAKEIQVDPEAVADVRAAKGLSDAELAAIPRPKLLGAVKKLRTPMAHYPLEWMRSRLDVWKDENGLVPENALIEARKELDELSGAEAAGGFSSASWTALGPGNIGGRVRSLLIHPTTPSVMFCGSVGGGIWKSVDSGASWNVVDDFMGSLSISGIVFEPGDPNVMYAGTGESFAGDGLRGAGVLKSVDGGTTWSQLAATSGPNFHYVNRLSFSADGAVLLAATQTGIWRSVDGGASFVNALAGTGNQGSRDAKFHPALPNVVVADKFDYDFAQGTWFHALAYSTNGGVSFVEAPGTRANGWSSRIEVAWHKGWTGAGNGCAYAMRNTAGGELLRSVNGGATWSLASSTSILNGVGWYYNALWVDPSDADANPNDDVVLSGGMDLWRSVDGGASFTKITEWFSWPASPHADHHAIAEDPGFDGAGNRRVYIGNDGGVWKTDDVYAAATLSGWTSLNNQLAITQAYGASICPANGVVQMGTQDNGTLRYAPAGGPLGWTTTFGGDGGFCASDPGNPALSYGEYVNAQIFRSSNGGVSGEYVDGKYWNGSNYVWKAAPYVIGDAQAGTAEFIAPFVMDPNSPTTLLVGGRSLWRTTNASAPLTATTGPSWTSVKPPLASNSNITAIAVAPTNSNIVWVGHGNGHVFASSNALAAVPTWTRKDLGAPNLPNRYVTRITIDPANSQRVLVTFGGFSSDNLWRTTDGGSVWTAATGLPAVPLRDVEIGVSNPLNLYAASELGLLVSEDDGATWSASVDGPARVSIDELFWSGNYLYLATHGRGMFRATPWPAQSVAVGTGCQLGVAAPLGSPPNLLAGAPVLGSIVALTVLGAPYPSTATVLIGGVPPSPVAVAPGCFAYLDAATAAPFATISILPGGAGAFSFLMPDVPALIGAQAALQAVVVPASGGLALSNGRVVTIGY